MSYPKTILIVDDEISVRRSLRAILEEDFNVVLCADGRHAVQFVSDHPGEVFAAFVDYAMPEMDGDVVCSALRALDVTISLVGFSAHEDAPFRVPLFARFAKSQNAMRQVHALAVNAVQHAAENRRR